MHKKNLQRLSLIIAIWSWGALAVLGQEGTLFEELSGEQETWEELLEAGELEELGRVLEERIAGEERMDGMLYFYLGEVAFYEEELEEAREQFERAEEQFRLDRNEEGEAASLLKLGLMASYEGDLVAAGQFFKEAGELAEVHQLSYLHVFILENQALLKAQGRELAQANNLLRQALHDMPDGHPAHTRLLSQLGTNYYSMGQTDTALVFMDSMLRVKKVTQEGGSRISDLSMMAELYQERGDFAEAQGRLMEAIGLAEAANDQFALLDLYTSIATVFAKQKRWEKVRFYAHRGLRLAEERGVQFNQAQNKELLGESHLHLDSISTGLDYLRKAFDQYKALKLPILAARVLLLLSKEQTDKGYLQAARAYLRDAFRVRENTADRLGSLQAMLLLAELELLEGNSSYALSLLQQCEAESREMGAQNHLQRSHELLAKAYQKEGKYETALYHFKVYTAIKDSIQSVEIAREVEQLEIQFQTAETKKQLAEQQATNAQQTNALQAQNFQLLLLIIGIALAVLLTGFLQFRNTKNKQLLAQRIQVMEKEQEAQQLKALIAGEEKERKRVAQELHDGLGVLLATVKMQINGIQKVLPGVSNSNHYQKAEQLIDQACRTVREISHDMLPYVLEEEGFDSAVQRLCTSVANTHELDISFIPFEVELIEGDALKVSLYRSVQELLKNIIKHAEASEVIVQIIAEPEQVELTVEDNGKGFDLAAKKDGIGLKNIQSRVEYLNGQFEMESTIGQGSTFTIRIPLENDAL